jgi:osmotically-inducible protein OsmY
MLDRLSTYHYRLSLDDDELQQAIVDKLQDDPAYLNGRRMRVTVEVDDGEVTVRGSVRTALERRKVDIVARALGASTVTNEIVAEENAATSTTPRRTRSAGSRLATIRRRRVRV